jgi:hypothetical protein
VEIGGSGPYKVENGGTLDEVEQGVTMKGRMKWERAAMECDL